MIKIEPSGDYVQLKYVDAVTETESVQEELKSDSDAIEYSSSSNGKIYLKFGRMTFEYSDPTGFEIDGSSVTDAADFISKLTALFSSSPGGVQSVTGANGINVDVTDPDNPEASLDTASFEIIPPEYSFGDINGVGNGTKIYIDDSAKKVRIQKGAEKYLTINDDPAQYKFGDIDGIVSQIFLKINATTRQVSLGDVNGNGNNASVNIDDIAKTANIGAFPVYIMVDATGNFIDLVAPDIKINGNNLNQANGLIQLDGDSKLPAIDGSQLTNLPQANSGYTEKLFRITQTGTNAPFVTSAVGNTGIDITPSRLDVGSYRFTFSASITTANCDFYFQIGQNPNGVVVAFINSITTSRIDVLTLNTSMAEADLGGGEMYMRMIVKP